MTTEQFWEIVEDSHDKSMTVNEQKLFARLTAISEAEILAFDRIWTEHYYRLYTNALWGAAHLAQGWCSDDGFMDWRNWIISCGREAFEIALDRPDDLVPLIDSEPDAGCEGIAYIADNALRAKNPQWEGVSPVHDTLVRPKEPAGPRWASEEDLRMLLPKVYHRYVENPTAVEKKMQDPETLVKTFGAKLGEPQVFRPSVEEVEIGSAKGRRLTFTPVPKKPWWKFWK